MSATSDHAGSHAADAPRPVTHRIRGVIEQILAAAGGLLLVTMSVLVIVQVFTRYVLGDPVDWTEELVRYVLIWTGFIGAAYAFSTRKHMALTFVRDLLPSATRRAILIGTDLLVLLFALLVMLLGGAWLAQSAMPDQSALLGISRGLVYTVAPVSAAFIVVIQLLNIVETLRGIPAPLTDETDADEDTARMGGDRS